MKSIFLLSVIALCCYNAYPQGYGNTWVFGDSAGLKFTDSGTEFFNSRMMSFEASASISDSLGNLLFYTNGQQVMNKNYDIMPNGDGLEIGQVITGDGSSITQGVVIIPYPNSTSLYYTFQLAGLALAPLKYSIVDMNLNGSLGDVSEKNIGIELPYLTEKMQVVKHANGRDWWLIVQKAEYEWTEIGEIRPFIKFLVTNTGIQEPFYQYYAPAFNPDDWASNGGAVGEMVFNQDGNKLANIRGYDLDIYDFDRCTGELSNLKSIINVQNENCLYGCAFSPDGTKVYVTTLCDGGKNLFQYCLNCDVPLDSTKTLIYKAINGNFWLGQHELGIDGKIYLVTAYGGASGALFHPTNQNLCVINSPNELGFACDFDTNTISLGDRRVTGGLPNMPNYNLGALRFSPCDTLNVALTNLPNQEAFTIYPNPASTIVTIKGNIKMQDVVTIQSLDGQLVYTYTNSAATKQIPVTALANGVYVLQIVRNNAVYYSEKLVIMR